MSKKIVKELVTKWTYQVDTSQVSSAKKAVASLRREFADVKRSSSHFAKAEMYRLNRLKASWRNLVGYADRYQKATSGGVGKGGRGGTGGGGRGRGGVSTQNSLAFLAGRALGSTALTSAILGGGAVVAGYVGAAAVQKAADRETSEKRFEGLLGSKEAANDMLDTITEFGKRTPFAITQLRQLTTQALGGGFKASEIIPLFEQLGDVTQGNSVEMGRMLTNMIEIKNVTKAFTRDIRQFGRAGIPVFAQLKKDLGVSGEELDKLISSGKIGYDQISNALNNLRKGQFKDAMAKQLDTFNQAMSNFGDILENIGERMGRPFLRPLTVTIQAFGNFLDRSVSSFGAIFEGLGSMVETLSSGLWGLASDFPVITSILVAGLATVAGALFPVTASLTALFLVLEDIGAYFDGRRSVIGRILGVEYDENNRAVANNVDLNNPEFKSAIQGVVNASLPAPASAVASGGSVNNNYNQSVSFGGGDDKSVQQGMAAANGFFPAESGIGGRRRPKSKN